MAQETETNDMVDADMLDSPEGNAASDAYALKLAEEMGFPEDFMARNFPEAVTKDA
jgi:hypothetical protein